MNKINYDALMQSVIAENGGKKTLLLHACCAPCSSACLEKLKDHFFITALFYNPNISGGEYFKRKEELVSFLNATGWAEFSDCPRDEEAFAEAAKGLENCKEGGARCARCFKLRLEKTAQLAAEGGYDYFSTTLTLSPLKDAQLLNAIGYAAAEKYGATWLPCDFKKRNGYLRSLQLSREYSLYRQNYCGCIYSAAQTLESKDIK